MQDVLLVHGDQGLGHRVGDLNSLEWIEWAELAEMSGEVGSLEELHDQVNDRRVTGSSATSMTSTRLGWRT